MTATLSCEQLSISVAGRNLVENLSLSLPAGSITCILGLNGSGKTLTLHTLAGLRASTSGSIKLFGDELNELSRRQIATRLGLLLQVHEDAFPVTVLEAVMMGQYSQLGFWEQASASGEQTARQVIEELGLAGFGNRLINSLSGGERRRVAIGTMRIQNPDIWLLDEPTNHLDPQHQMSVMKMLQVLSSQGKTVVASIHDPMLAARYANYALLLHGNGQWEFDKAEQLLTPARMQALYAIPYESIQGERFSSLVPA
jgi:iron complex transport system ATP-binding protein